MCGRGLCHSIYEGVIFRILNGYLRGRCSCAPCRKLQEVNFCMHRLIHYILRAILASPASCPDSPIDLSLLKSDDPAGYSGEYSIQGIFSNSVNTDQATGGTPRVLQLASQTDASVSTCIFGTVHFPALTQLVVTLLFLSLLTAPHLLAKFRLDQQTLPF